MNITKGKIAKAQKFVIYGVEGIGKTSLAAQFPNPLFIDTEGSTSNMDVVRMDKPTSWTMLKQQITYIKQHKPCSTLIIDTIDWAERLAIEFICERSSKISITDFGWGEGFTQLEQETGKFLNFLSDLTEIGINVGLIAHAKITRFDDPGEMGAYDRYELKLGNKTTGKTSALIKEWADMVLFARYKVLSVATDDKGKKFKGQGGQRVLNTTHHPAWDAKNRFNLPDEIPLDFAAIAHIFNVTPNVQVEDSPTSFDPKTVPPVSDSVSNDFPKENNIDVSHASNVDYASSEYAGVLPALLDLMKVEDVTGFEVMEAVHQAYNGAFPQDMEFKNLPSDFINQALMPNWGKALEKIKENRITGGAF